MAMLVSTLSQLLCCHVQDPVALFRYFVARLTRTKPAKGNGRVDSGWGKHRSVQSREGTVSTSEAHRNGRAGEGTTPFGGHGG